MTREEAKTNLDMIRIAFGVPVTKEQKELVEETFEMAIQALSQEPCELLIIKSDILLHQDDRKKWMESIKREKENGVIILPPYFEPLLVPNDIEINIEQEPCDDAISREQLLKVVTGDSFKSDYPRMSKALVEIIKALPPVSTTKNIVNHGTMNIAL